MSQSVDDNGRTPLEADAVRVRAPKHAAAGISAIAETVRVSVGEMGARRAWALLRDVNQKDGFDCQSCAWPSPDGERHRAEFCENGAKAIASEGTRRQISAAFFGNHSIDDLAGRSDQWLNEQGRLVEPLVLRAGERHYTPISWANAFEMIATELGRLDSPDEATFYTSGRTSNEAAFLYQLFVRQFGTNNLPDCSNMCHESSGTAMEQTIGVGKSTVVFSDFDETDTIFVIGQNPGTNHPRMLTALERAKRNGATIVSINPMPEPGLLRVRNPNPQEASNPIAYGRELLGRGTKLADLHLPVRVNGDVALLNGIMKVMLEIEAAAPGSVVDRRFVDQYTAGFDDFARDVAALGWDEIVASSGVPLETIREAGRIVAESKRLIACWAMGLTQHRNGVANVASVINLLLIGGHMGRPGAGACCVRGHSNVQGDRTMGIWERAPGTFLDSLEQEFNFSSPREPGLDSVDSLSAMHEGRVKVFVGLGGNLLAAAPDTDFTSAAMRRCRMTVHVATKLNRGHLVPGEVSIVLPCLGRSEVDRQAAGEQFVTVEDSLGVISSSRGSQPPPSEQLRSEPAIVAGLARAVLGDRSTVDWNALAADYDTIRDHIANVIPGFEDFNRRIKADIFTLPNSARSRRFETDSGRAEFVAQTIPPDELEAGELLLTTVRSHDQFNTTIYGPNDRYRGVYGGRRVIFVNPADLEALGLGNVEMVDVTSHFAGRERVAPQVQVVPYPIARRSAAMYFPEANVLVPIDSVAEQSNTPTSKSVRISLAPTPPATGR